MWIFAQNSYNNHHKLQCSIKVKVPLKSIKVQFTLCLCLLRVTLHITTMNNSHKKSEPNQKPKTNLGSASIKNEMKLKREFHLSPTDFLLIFICSYYLHSPDALKCLIFFLMISVNSLAITLVWKYIEMRFFRLFVRDACNCVYIYFAFASHVNVFAAAALPNDIYSINTKIDDHSSNCPTLRNNNNLVESCVYSKTCLHQYVYVYRVEAATVGNTTTTMTTAVKALLFDNNNNNTEKWLYSPH